MIAVLPLAIISMTALPFDNRTASGETHNASGKCEQITAHVDLCSLPPNWQQVPSENPYAVRQFHSDNDFFAQVLIENAGEEQGLTLKGATDSILAGMERQPSASEFVVLMRGTNPAYNFNSEVVLFSVKLDGIPFVYAETIIVGAKHNIQFVTWRIASEPTVDDRAAHLEFGNSFQMLSSF